VALSATAISFCAIASHVIWVDFGKNYFVSIQSISTRPLPLLHTEADDHLDKQGSGQLVAGKPLEEFFWVCDKSISIVPRRPFLIKYCHPHPDYKQNPDRAFLRAALKYFQQNKDTNIYQFTYQNREVQLDLISESESTITVKTKLDNKTLTQSFKVYHDPVLWHYDSPLPKDGVGD
jgi:hypothetical protein